MDIILDTNIFRGDLLLRSKDFEVLIDYLEKTGSRFLLPQIILEEVKGLFLRTLQERQQVLKKAISNINLSLIDSAKHISIPTIDCEKELEEYVAYIRKKFDIKDYQILSYKNEYLPLIAERAIKRLKPAGEDGQGFRDTLIWLTIKDYTQNVLEKQITFISNNDSDFGSSDKTKLHETLISECENLGIKINYFRTTKEFIENHSTKIDFITFDWLASKVDYELIDNLVCEHINGREKSKERITSSFNSHTGNETTGYCNAFNVHPYEDKDIFIYEMVDNKLIVNFTISAEIEIEIEYYKPTYRNAFDYEEYYSNYERTATIETKVIDSEIYVALTVENGEIIDTEISEWDFYSRW